MADQLNSSEGTTSISEEQVVEYLRKDPEFFIRHESLLNELRLPHQSGKAISLVERQVHVFREQRDELRQELNELISIARQNDRFFEKSKRLLMNLLEAQSLEEVAIMVEESIRNDFGLDHCSLLIFGEKFDYPVSNIEILPFSDVQGQIGTLVESRKAVCGQFTPEQLGCLFPHVDKGEVGSAAVIPLRHGEDLGMFSLGSKDAAYFEGGMGSLFLSYISDSLSRILPPMLLRERRRGAADAVTKLMDS